MTVNKTIILASAVGNVNEVYISGILADRMFVLLQGTGLSTSKRIDRIFNASDNRDYVANSGSLKRPWANWPN